MAEPSLSELRAELSATYHVARVRRMVELGRQGPAGKLLEGLGHEVRVVDTARWALVPPWASGWPRCRRPRGSIPVDIEQPQGPDGVEPADQRAAAYRGGRTSANAAAGSVAP